MTDVVTDYWKKIFIFCLSGCLVCPNKVTRNKNSDLWGDPIYLFFISLL